MKKIITFCLAVVVFILFSAIGYAVMTGGMAKYSDVALAEAVDRLFAPVISLTGSGIAGGAMIIIGSIISGVALFRKTGDQT